MQKIYNYSIFARALAGSIFIDLCIVNNTDSKVVTNTERKIIAVWIILNSAISEPFDKNKSKAGMFEKLIFFTMEEIPKAER